MMVPDLQVKIKVYYGFPPLTIGGLLANLAYSFYYNGEAWP